MDFTFGWWLVLTLEEGGTIEGYKIAESDHEIVLRRLIFLKDDEPGQSEIAVDKEGVIQIDAYRERPPV